MKMRKEWWYVFALALLVLIVAVVFKEDINFSPGKKAFTDSVDRDAADGGSALNTWAVETFGAGEDSRKTRFVLGELKDTTLGDGK